MSRVKNEISGFKDDCESHVVKEWSRVGRQASSVLC